MHCGERARRQRKGYEPAAVAGDPKAFPEEGLRCGRAERHDDSRFDDSDLRLEPGKASLDLDRARFAVNAARPTRHPFEVLDDICDVNLPAVDPRFYETAVEKLSRRPDKGMSGQVFGIARLLPDQHDPGSLPPFTEHGLRGVPV